MVQPRPCLQGGRAQNPAGFGRRPTKRRPVAIMNGVRKGCQAPLNKRLRALGAFSTSQIRNRIQGDFINARRKRHSTHSMRQDRFGQVDACGQAERELRYRTHRRRCTARRPVQGRVAKPTDVRIARRVSAKRDRSEDERAAILRRALAQEPATSFGMPTLRYPPASGTPMRKLDGSE
jgi:hypothetical protein